MSKVNTSSAGAPKLYLIARGGQWHYRRRVPKNVQHLVDGKFVFRTTGCAVGDRAQAEATARSINDATERHWQMLLDGITPPAAEDAYAKAVERARRVGFGYLTAGELAAGPLSEIIERALELQATGLNRSRAVVEAVYGGVDAPRLMLGDLAVRYFDVATDRQRNQLAGTNRNWRNRRTEAVSKAVEVIGNKPLADITRPDVVRFRLWLIEQVAAGAFQAPYANKILGNLSTMVRELNDVQQLGLVDMFAGLRLSDAHDEQRPPFDPDFVAGTLLTGPALAGMSREGRAVIAMIASTGMRPIEFARLRPGNIVLDHNVPHIRIRPAGTGAKAAAEAGLKVRHTARDIPLIGSALEAARAFPGGLVHYADKANSMTSAIGKYLRDHDLLPTDRHSLYSLRHTFKDRLRAVQAPEELIDQLMGHKTRKPAYGEGYPLHVLAEWVARVAFDPMDGL